MVNLKFKGAEAIETSNVLLLLSKRQDIVMGPRKKASEESNSIKIRNDRYDKCERMLAEILVVQEILSSFAHRRSLSSRIAS